MRDRNRLTVLTLFVSLTVLFSYFSVYAGQGSSCLKVEDSSDGEIEDEEDFEVVPYRPLNNPFYYFGLREQILSYMGPAELMAFEKVNQACRQDAYKIDHLRWKKRWAKAGMHLVTGSSPETQRLFQKNTKLFRIEDFILSGSSKRRMSWNRAVRFCETVGGRMSSDFGRRVSCEVLDNSQWQTLIDVSKKNSGLYDVDFIPHMNGVFWSSTPFGPTGSAHFTYNGMTQEFSFGFLLPRMLFLLRSDEVEFFVRCACKEFSKEQ